MIAELTVIIREQKEALKELLEQLDKQYKLIIDKDVFGLDKIVEDINLCNKKIAETEVKRRKITGNDSIIEIVKHSNNEELDTEFREITKTLHMLKLQKETNEILIRQGLGFTNKLLNILNPKKEANLYNSYGHIRR